MSPVSLPSLVDEDFRAFVGRDPGVQEVTNLLRLAGWPLALLAVPVLIALALPDLVGPLGLKLGDQRNAGGVAFVAWLMLSANHMTGAALAAGVKRVYLGKAVDPLAVTRGLLSRWRAVLWWPAVSGLALLALGLGIWGLWTVGGSGAAVVILLLLAVVAIPLFLWLEPRLTLMGSVVGLERVDGPTALRRSWQLSAGRWRRLTLGLFCWQVFGVRSLNGLLAFDDLALGSQALVALITLVAVGSTVVYEVWLALATLASRVQDEQLTPDQLRRDANALAG